MKGCVIFFLDFRYNFPNIFNIISKSFATYGCCHPCFFMFTKIYFVLENDQEEKRVVIQLEDIECELIFIDQHSSHISVS